MKSTFRRTLIVAAGIAVLGAASTAFAGNLAGMVEKARDDADDRRQSEPAPQAAPQRKDPGPAQSRPAPAPAPAPAQVPAQAPRERDAPPPVQRTPVVVSGNRRDGGNSGAMLGRARDRQDDRRPPASQAPPRQDANSGQPRSVPAPSAPVVSGRGGSAGGNDRGVMDQLLGRSQRGGNGGGGNGGGIGNGNGPGDHDGPRSGGGHQPPRIVPSLPRGYRNYYWNNQPYYSFGGSWYQPYGSSFISIGIPYGLFVASLPGYSSSFYYGNSRYYYYDDTYYVYDPARRGYVVSPSPYGEEEADEYYDDDAGDQDMFIYPARGQSEQQQADDRYECHRWGADQTHYNPLDDAYDRAKHADYVRAMTACLTGRGYSVR